MLLLTPPPGSKVSYSTSEIDTERTNDDIVEDLSFDSIDGGQHCSASKEK